MHLDRCGLLPDFLRNRDAPIVTMAGKSQPTAEIFYVYVANNESYRNMATRFLDSYHQYTPGYEHSTVICCNLGMPGKEMKARFMELPRARFFMHDNSGFDIGAYQAAARQSNADLLLFLTASTFFNGPGWLKRAVEVYQKHGDALYGTMGNRGDARYNVNRHIRSTGFWITRHLFNQYPVKVKTRDQRYEFEHKRNCITEWCMRNGLKALVVTPDKEYEWENWDDDPEGFNRGQQKNVMIQDHICEPPYYPRK